MITTIGTVLEAAEIRQEQWSAIADGVGPHDVVDELYETDSEEAASIAEEQSAAISAVRDSLPAKGTSTPLDVLANNAMCICEHVLEVQRAWKQHSTLNEPLHEWIADGEGAFAARDGCWALAGWAEFAFDYYESTGPTELDSFDWEFIPAFVDQLYAVCVSREVPPARVEEAYVKMAVDAIRKA